MLPGLDGMEVSPSARRSSRPVADVDRTATAARTRSTASRSAPTTTSPSRSTPPAARARRRRAAAARQRPRLLEEDRLLVQRMEELLRHAPIRGSPPGSRSCAPADGRLDSGRVVVDLDSATVLVARPADHLLGRRVRAAADPPLLPQPRRHPHRAHRAHLGAPARPTATPAGGAHPLPAREDRGGPGRARASSSPSRDRLPLRPAVVSARSTMTAASAAATAPAQRPPAAVRHHLGLLVLGAGAPGLGGAVVLLALLPRLRRDRPHRPHPRDRRDRRRAARAPRRRCACATSSSATAPRRASPCGCSRRRPPAGDLAARPARARDRLDHQSPESPRRSPAMRSLGTAKALIGVEDRIYDAVPIPRGEPAARRRPHVALARPAAGPHARRPCSPCWPRWP